MKVYYTRSEIAGEAFVRRILKTEYGVSAPEIARTATGKPRLQNAPLFFSVSHCDGMTAAAVDGEEVGLDLERRTRREYRAIFRRMTSAEREEDFFRVWTAKEAYVKWKGQTLAALYRSLEYRGGVLYENGTPLSVSFFHAELHGCELCLCAEKTTDVEFAELR